MSQTDSFQFFCIRSVQMHSDASGYVRMHSDMIGKNFETKLLETSDDQIWRTFGEVFEELRQNGRHKQVPRNFDPDTFIWSSIRPLELVLVKGAILGWPARALFAGSWWWAWAFMWGDAHPD